MTQPRKPRSTSVIHEHKSQYVEWPLSPVVVPDMINSPPHYTSHPSKVECIEITRHMGFNLGSALKYLWRCGLKGDEIEDLKKARWYIDDEIKLRESRKGIKP